MATDKNIDHVPPRDLICFFIGRSLRLLHYTYKNGLYIDFIVFEIFSGSPKAFTSLFRILLQW